MHLKLQTDKVGQDGCGAGLCLDGDDAFAGFGTDDWEASMKVSMGEGCIEAVAGGLEVGLGSN